MKISLEELFKIIAKSLNIKTSRVNLKTKDTDLEEWDSLGQLSIISALDKKFNGKVKFESAASLVNINSIANFLKKKKLLK